MKQFSKTALGILILISVLFAENLQNYGIGFIADTSSSDPFYKIHKNGFQLFNPQTGKSEGIVSLYEDGTIQNDDGDIAETVRTSYMGYSLVILDISGDYLKLKSNGEALWVSINDIKSKGFSYILWSEFLREYEGDAHYIPYESTTTLYRSPSGTADVVDEIQGCNVTILKVGSNNWVQVEAYEGGMCEEPARNRRWGWIQLVKKDKTPAVWILFDGC